MSRRSHSRTLIPRAIVPIVAATSLVLATAGGVLAKCEHPDAEGICPAGVVATFDPGGTLTAGSAATVGLWIHDGEVPYVAESVAIVFSRVGDGTTLRVSATPTDLTGRWQATVELPAGGTWVLAADITGPDFAGSLALDPIQVSPPLSPPAGGPRTTPAAPALPWVALLAFAVLAATIGGFAARIRRREAAIQG